MMKHTIRNAIHLAMAFGMAGCVSAPGADPVTAYRDALVELVNRCTVKFMNSPVARGDQSGCMPVQELLKPEIEAAQDTYASQSPMRKQIQANAESANHYLGMAFLHQIVVHPRVVTDRCYEIASWKQ
jgi:hypothetical protein